MISVVKSTSLLRPSKRTRTYPLPHRHVQNSCQEEKNTQMPQFNSNKLKNNNTVNLGKEDKLTKFELPTTFLKLPVWKYFLFLLCYFDIVPILNQFYQFFLPAENQFYIDILIDRFLHYSHHKLHLQPRTRDVCVCWTRLSICPPVCSWMKDYSVFPHCHLPLLLLRWPSIVSCLETARKEVLSIHCILSPPPYIPPSLIRLPPSLEPLHVFAFVSSPFSISNMLSLSSSIHCTDSSSFHPVLFVWLIGCAPNPHAHTPFYSPLFIVPALSFTGHKTLALR